MFHLSNRLPLIQCTVYLESVVKATRQRHGRHIRKWIALILCKELRLCGGMQEIKNRRAHFNKWWVSLSVRVGVTPGVEYIISLLQPGVLRRMFVKTLIDSYSLYFINMLNEFSWDCRVKIKCMLPKHCDQN